MIRTVAFTVVALLMSATAPAQLGKPTQEELTRSGNGPGPVPGGSPAAPPQEVKEVPPSVDRRNFSGVWRIRRNPGGLAAAAAAGGVRPVATNLAAGQLPNNILCMPMPGTTIGVDGPMRIIQSDDLIIWMAEQGHVVRRIWVNGRHSDGFKPNHLGEAVARFDGDTLIVETVGLKSLPQGARMVERWSKSTDGRQLDMTIEDLDAQGVRIGNARAQTVTWRGGEEVFEWMCEDYNDEWLPGGTDFQDQVAK